MSGGTPAYDYDAQRWVEPGPEAEALHLKHALHVLECIDLPAYRRMMGHTDEVAVRIRSAALWIVERARAEGRHA